MTSVTIQEREQKSLHAELKGYKHGFLVTIHSTSSDNADSFPLNFHTLDRFKNHLDDIRRALGIFCYGRTFRRKNAEIRIVGALEIGECGRLHAHLAVLSDHECEKSVDEVKQRLKEVICPHFSSVASGENAFDVRAYDRSKLQKLVAYLFKQRVRVRNRFGIDGLI